MKTRDSKLQNRQPAPDGGYRDVNEALAAVSQEQWKGLARLAECLLRDLRSDPRLARYLAGVHGEEIVNTAVLAVQRWAASPGIGRAVDGDHLKESESFLAHLKQIIRSIANNFRRHKAGRVFHQPIGDQTLDCSACEPVDSSNLEKDVALKDLIRVLLPRVFQDLQKKPKQLSVLREWARADALDPVLPPVESKFVRFCLRQAVLKQLRRLAASDLKLNNPTGKELLF